MYTLMDIIKLKFVSKYKIAINHQVKTK